MGEQIEAFEVRCQTHGRMVIVFMDAKPENSRDVSCPLCYAGVEIEARS